MSEQFGYGSNFYKMVSEDLQTILPDVKSFSPTNLKYMRYFYEMYSELVICPQVEDDLFVDENRPQAGDDLKIVFRIPWGHNKIILDKCKGNIEKALFYAQKTVENNWSNPAYYTDRQIPVNNADGGMVFMGTGCGLSLNPAMIQSENIESSEK